MAKDEKQKEEEKKEKVKVTPKPKPKTEKKTEVKKPIAKKPAAKKTTTPIKKVPAKKPSCRIRLSSECLHFSSKQKRTSSKFIEQQDRNTICRKRGNNREIESNSESF